MQLRDKKQALKIYDARNLLVLADWTKLSTFIRYF